MAAPGTLLPADVLNVRDTTANSYNDTMNQNLLPWRVHNSGDDLFKSELLLLNGGTGTSHMDDNGVLDQRSRYENALLLPKVPSIHPRASSTDMGSSSGASARILYPPHQTSQYSTTQAATSSKQKEVCEVTVRGDSSQDTVDSRNLFSELNPFQAGGVGKPSAPFKPIDNKNVEYQRRGEKIAEGPGKLPPLVWKNRTPCNVIQNTKPNNCVEGPPPRKNLVECPNISNSHSSSLAGRECSEGQNVRSAAISSYSAGVGTSYNERNDSSSGSSSSSVASATCHDSGLDSRCNDVPLNKQLIPIQSSGDNYMEKNQRNGWASQNRIMDEMKEHGKNVIDKNNRKKSSHDRLMGRNVLSENSSASSLQPRPSRLDPMLDDVSEWEILWEHLVIGERIGLGNFVNLN